MRRTVPVAVEIEEVVESLRASQSRTWFHCRAGGFVQYLLRAAKPNIKIGGCREDAGDPPSIKIFALRGVDYISCSPARIPVAQLAAAQASLATYEVSLVLRQPNIVGTLRG